MKRGVLIGLGAVAVAVAVGVLVATAGAVGVYAGPGHTSATNKAAAKSDTAKLLTAVQLPPGATPSATEPAGDGGSLAVPGPHAASPNAVDAHQWWTVPGAAADVLSYVNAHPPAGSKWGGGSSGGGPGGPYPNTVQFDWPSIANVLGTRSMIVSIVQLPRGQTGVRVDAVDIWVRPRPRAERIPRSVDRLQVTVVAGAKVRQGPLTFDSHRRVHAAASVIDSLPLFPPGPYSCPADFGITVRLEFFAPGRVAPAAIVTDDPAGCSTVSVRIGGHAYPQLAGWGFPPPDATHRLDRALGVHLRARPPGL